MLIIPAIFKSHAVFQRDKVFRVWGEADTDFVRISVCNPNGEVLVSNGARYETVIKVIEGRFMGEMLPVEAGGPYILKVENCVENSSDSKCAFNEQNDITEHLVSIIFEDVYFGDVWIAGGQSNMEFQLKNSKYAEEEISDCQNEWIRFYNVPRIAWVGDELTDAESASEWQLCDKENVGEWSAAAYYFAKALTEESESIMIGIVGCNWGGTSASAWMSREKLLQYKETSQYIEAYDKAVEGISDEEYLRAYDEYVVYQAEFDKNVGQYYQTCANPTWDEAISLFGENKYPGPMGFKNWTRPCGLYETMLKRIIPYSAMGCIYYQGEEDDNRPYSYKRLLTSLIEQWREDFMDEKFAFIVAQLPIFVNEGEEDYKNWPFIREAQYEVGNSLGDGVAVILESGEYHNIHPSNKETVGYRLAFQALHRVYGCMAKWDACGPEYDAGFVSNGAFYVDLKCCDSGLLINGDDNFLEDVHMMDYLPSDSGFEIAGDDGVYYNAKAQVMRGENVSEEKDEDEICDPLYDDNSQSAPSIGSILTIKLTSDKVDNPKYARYFWKNYGKVRIFGANGIPLAPFRTDKTDGARALGTRLGEIIDVI